MVSCRYVELGGVRDGALQLCGLWDGVLQLCGVSTIPKMESVTGSLFLSVNSSVIFV